MATVFSRFSGPLHHCDSHLHIQQIIVNLFFSLVNYFQIYFFAYNWNCFLSMTESEEPEVGNHVSLFSFT